MKVRNQIPGERTNVLRTKKIGLASVILGVGLALAWQFRKSADPQLAGTDPSPRAAVPGETANGDPAATTQVTLSGRIEPLDQPAAQADSRTEMRRPSEWSPKRPNENFSAPSPGDTASGSTTAPNLLTTFPGADRAARPPAAGSLEPSFHEPHADPIAEEAEPERTHTIVDGDTLARLAERYLGSAARADEIFAYNRDVLPDAELLPIGAQLRIPNRSAARLKPRIVAQPIGQSREAPAPSPPGLISAAADGTLINR